MAEANKEKDESRWWNSWLHAAKEKSLSTFEVIKKDLSEFTCTMSTDTSQAVATASDKLKESLNKTDTDSKTSTTDKVRNGITSFLEGLSESLMIQGDDQEPPSSKPVRNSDPIYDRAKARLHAVQVDADTYCSPPSGPGKLYTEWAKTFVLEDHKGDISELLVSNVEVRAFYTKLVPAEISHGEFWKRYFYRVHQLQQDEARKLDLMKRAEQVDSKDDLGWEDDWSGDEEHLGERKMEIITNDNKPSHYSPNNENRTSNDLVFIEKQETEITEDKTKTEKPQDFMGEDPQKSKDDKCSKTEKSETETQKECMNEDHLNTQSTSTANRSTRDCEQKQAESMISETGKVIEAPLLKANVTSAQNNSVITTPEIVSESQKPGSEQDETVKFDTPEAETSEITTKEKGELVVVNPDRDTPSSDSSAHKDSIDDDWEKDLDTELTEEDLRAADEIAKKLNLNPADYTKLAGEIEEDWESWE